MSIFSVVGHLKDLTVWAEFLLRWNRGKDEIRRDLYYFFLHGFFSVRCSVCMYVGIGDRYRKMRQSSRQARRAAAGSGNG